MRAAWGKTKHGPAPLFKDTGPEWRMKDRVFHRIADVSGKDSGPSADLVINDGRGHGQVLGVKILQGHAHDFG